MRSKADEFLPTRASLLKRLKDWDDHESWGEFYAIYRKLIFATAIKSGLSEAEAEDVVQETAISVAKTIKDFEYDRSKCTFKSWLRFITQKRIADHFRKRSREPRVSRERTSASAKTPLLERVPDPDSLDFDGIWEEEWKQNLLEAAVERVRKEASPEQFQIFDLYVLRKMPAKKVAATLDVSVPQIYLARHRVTRLIKKEVKYLEGRMG